MLVWWRISAQKSFVKNKSNICWGLRLGLLAFPLGPWGGPLNWGLVNLVDPFFHILGTLASGGLGMGSPVFCGPALVGGKGSKGAFGCGFFGRFIWYLGGPGKPGGWPPLVLGPGGGGTGCWSPDGPALGEGGYSFGGGVRVTSKFGILDGLELGECGGVLSLFGVW